MLFANKVFIHNMEALYRSFQEHTSKILFSVIDAVTKKANIKEINGNCFVHKVRINGSLLVGSSFAKSMVLALRPG
jgi:tRNA A37 threonylcarbamoyltransferase TsaD